MWRTLCRKRGNWYSRVVLGVAICSLLVVLAGSNRNADLNYSGQLMAAVNPPINMEAQQQAEIERVCFKEAPFSVLMSWQEPKGIVDKVLYVAKDGNTTMLVRPAGLAGMLVHTVRKDVHDPKLRTTCLRTPNQFGFGQALARIIRAYEVAKEQGVLNTQYLGIKEVNGRECLVLVSDLPIINDRPAYRLVTFLDKDYLLPTRIESYDASGERFSVYTYLDVRFNLGLTDELFSAKANGFDN